MKENNIPKYYVRPIHNPQQYRNKTNYIAIGIGPQKQNT